MVNRVRIRSGFAVAAAAAIATSGLFALAQPAFASGKNPVNPSWPTTLVFGEVGAENATTLDASLAPVQKAMQKDLGIKLQVLTGTSYASMIEAQQAGKAQLVGYGPFSWYIAKQIDHLPITDIGILITAPHTDGGYYSEAVVNPKLNPKIKSLKDAKGAKVCFSDPASTSGYLYPSYGLLSVGISPSKGVTPVFAGTDTATALQASKGSCQIGFTNNQNLPQAEESGAIKKSDVKIIWTGPEIPGNPVAVSNAVPASLRKALEKFFVKDANAAYLSKHGFCSSAAACQKTMGQWGYANPKVANFGKIKQVCALTKSPSCSKP